MSGSSNAVFMEHLYKVLVIGDGGVGKTSFVKRYVRNLFTEDYKSSIGVDFALKVINWDSNNLVRMQLWDIAGQEMVRKMTRSYYKEAVGAFVIYDMSTDSSFEGALNWKHDLDNKVRLANGSPIPAVLLANKCDQSGLVRRDPSLVDNLCKDEGFIGWFETSAKDNTNVDEAANFLIKHILCCDSEASHEDGITLSQESEATKDQSQCCNSQAKAETSN